MRNKHGDFIWYELVTTNARKAAEFYRSFLDWNVTNAEGVEFEYLILSAGEEDVAGMMNLPTAEDGSYQGSPGWLGYIGVDDVDESVERIVAAGGKVMLAPMDVPGVGRMAMMADPQGVPFYVMRGAVDDPSHAFDGQKVGHCNWNELTAEDPGAALEFYQDLFGWKKDETVPMGELGEYQLFNNGDAAIGGVMGRMDESPAAWLYYFGVGPIDRAVEAAQEAGGRLLAGVHEVPGGGFIAVFQDPQGAYFGMVGTRD
jgi:uncharacterized protein